MEDTIFYIRNNYFDQKTAADWGKEMEGGLTGSINLLESGGKENFNFISF